MHRLHRFLLTGVSIGLVGCQSYRARPLVPAEILREIEASRRQVEAGSPSAPGPDFATTARWMHAHSPRLRVARAEFQKAWVLARTKTPLPNPEIAFGPLIGSRLGEGAARRIQPMVEFGFTIPLSGRLGYQDEVNEVRARASAVDLAVSHRSEYLRLRQLYATWVLSHRRLEIHRGLRDSAQRSLDLTRRLVEAGDAGALDTGLMNLEVARREMALLDIRSQIAGLVEALSRRVGVHSDFFQSPGKTPALPGAYEIPARDRAGEILVANHPELAGLRARYGVAEKELRLEVARQYPDIRIGSSFEGDPGDKKKVWGLAVGITIPAFDRNQQAIATAEKERDRVRTQYEAALTRALAALEGALARVDLAARKQNLLKKEILPRARQNLEIAHQAIRAGAFNALEYLEVERTLRSVRITTLDAELQALEARFDLEQVMGVPLGLFPGETAGKYPIIPASMKQGKERQ